MESGDWIDDVEWPDNKLCSTQTQDDYLMAVNPAIRSATCGGKSDSAKKNRVKQFIETKFTIISE